MHPVGNIHITNEECHSSDSHVTATPENTSSTSDFSGNTHLASSQIISLQKLRDAIYTITQRSVSCQSLVELVGKVQRNGLCSTLLTKCSKCNKEIMFKTSNKLELKKSDKTVRSIHQVNVTAVMGQMATGGGCNNLEEFLCTIGIPSMSKPTFIEIERLLGSAFEVYLGKLMLKAGQEEKELAIQNNEYHQNVRAITVIVDGGWSFSGDHPPSTVTQVFL